MHDSTSDVQDVQLGSNAPDCVLTIDGVRTWVTKGGTGPPLLLVHGSGPGVDAVLSWEAITPELGENFSVIAMDMPGYGRSELLAVAETPVKVARHIVRVLDTLELEHVGLIGHSRGGRIACELAVLEPERVSALAIVASGSVAPGGLLTDDGDFTPSARALVSFGQDGSTDIESFKCVLRRMVYDPTDLPDELLSAAYTRFVESGLLHDYAKRMARLDPLAFYQELDGKGFGERLSRISAPTCIVWGRDDVTAPYARALSLLEIMPHAEFHVLPRCGHFPQVERRDAFVNLLRGFFASHLTSEEECPDPRRHSGPCRI